MVSYQKQEVERHVFVKIPQWLFSEPYNNLSSNAKLMYALLYDRLSLSLANKWIDENGETFQYFKNEKFCSFLNCSERTVIKIKKELTEAKLMSECRQGINLPNRIYLYAPQEPELFSGQELKDVAFGAEKSSVSELKNEVFGAEKNGQKELKKGQTNQTNNNQTENNQIMINYKAENNSAQKKISDAYQERIGSLDGQQLAMLMDYVNLDGMTDDMIIHAIGLAADAGSGKRNLRYILGILRSWKQNGILSMTAVMEQERDFQDRKAGNHSAGQTGQVPLIKSHTDWGI